MADPSSPSNDTLHLAVELGDEEAVKRLLKQCLNLNALDENGKTVLHLACIDRFKHSIMHLPKLHRIAELLLDNGASVHTPDKADCRTALHEAAFYNLTDTVALLLRRGANVRASDNRGYTPLHRAVHFGSENAIELLLSNGADIEAEDDYGATPLETAVIYGDTTTAKLLISRGANVHWDSTMWGRHHTLVHVSAKGNKVAALQLLLDAKLGVDTVVGGGKTALQVAAKRDYCLDAIKCLLRNGAQVNYRYQKNGFTALHFAVMNTATKNLEFLLEYGADLIVEDVTGETPVVFALGCNRLQTYSIFAKHLVRMKAQKLFISESNLKALSENDDLKSLCAPGKVEIGRMMETMIGDSKVNVFDFFTKGENRMADYVSNEIVERVLKDGKYETEFPIYGNIIRKKFLQGIERRDLLRQSTEWLFGVINEFYELPHDCVELINRRLTNIDLTFQVG